MLFFFCVCGMWPYTHVFPFSTLFKYDSLSALIGLNIYQPKANDRIQFHNETKTARSKGLSHHLCLKSASPGVLRRLIKMETNHSYKYYLETILGTMRVGFGR